MPSESISSRTLSSLDLHGAVVQTKRGAAACVCNCSARVIFTDADNPCPVHASAATMTSILGCVQTCLLASSSPTLIGHTNAHRAAAAGSRMPECPLRTRGTNKSLPSASWEKRDERCFHFRMVNSTPFLRDEPLATDTHATQTRIKLC